jgi:hypothetical protein
MPSAVQSKPGRCSFPIKLGLATHYRKGQKIRRRNFLKGYAEMLEKQHNQLVAGLQEMHQRLRKASLYHGEPLNESSGRPLTHNILAAMNFLEPTEEGFIEQPRSSSTLEEPEYGIDDASADPHQKILLSTPQMFG